MTFASQVRAFTKKATGQADTEFRKSVLLLYSDIVTGTPVRDGQLQNNWQFGVDNSLNSTLHPPVKEHSAPVSREKPKMESLRIKNTAVIFNNVVYAAVIENGLEGTARIPARMVARAIAKASARNKK